MTYIPKKLRTRVRQQGKYRCGYCLTSETIVGMPMEIDHYFPQSLGGLTEEDNLWPVCSLCNDHKNNRIAALDPITEENVFIFNPRTQLWNEHFEWIANGERIAGKTAIGRATVVTLNLNRPSLVHSRKTWISAGWHPPKE